MNKRQGVGGGSGRGSFLKNASQVHAPQILKSVHISGSIDSELVQNFILDILSVRSGSTDKNKSISVRTFESSQFCGNRFFAFSIRWQLFDPRLIRQINARRLHYVISEPKASEIKTAIQNCLSNYYCLDMLKTTSLLIECWGFGFCT